MRMLHIAPSVWYYNLKEAYQVFPAKSYPIKGPTFGHKILGFFQTHVHASLESWYILIDC